MSCTTIDTNSLRTASTSRICPSEFSPGRPGLADAPFECGPRRVEFLLEQRDQTRVGVEPTRSLERPARQDVGVPGHDVTEGAWRRRRRRSCGAGRRRTARTGGPPARSFHASSRSTTAVTLPRCHSSVDHLAEHADLPSPVPRRRGEHAPDEPVELVGVGRAVTHELPEQVVRVEDDQPVLGHGAATSTPAAARLLEEPHGGGRSRRRPRRRRQSGSGRGRRDGTGEIGLVVVEPNEWSPDVVGGTDRVEPAVDDRGNCSTVPTLREAFEPAGRYPPVACRLTDVRPSEDAAHGYGRGHDGPEDQDQRHDQAAPGAWWASKAIC